MKKDHRPNAQFISRLLLLSALICGTLASTPPVGGQGVQPVSYEKLLNDSSARQKEGKADQVQEIFNILAAGRQSVDAGEVALNLKRNWPAPAVGAPILVPAEVREKLILDGKENGRLQTVVKPLLNDAGLSNRIRLLLFKSEVPITLFVYPNALLVSTRAMSLLENDELAAVAAHEIVHLVGQKLYREAVDAGDERTQRMIELFCDAGAAALITNRGGDPRKLISGLYKMASVLENEFQDYQGRTKHPAMKQRKQLNEALVKNFTASISESRAGKR